MKNSCNNAVVTVGDLDNVTLRQRSDGKIEAVVPRTGSPTLCTCKEFFLDLDRGIIGLKNPDGTVATQWDMALVRRHDDPSKLVWGFPAPTAVQQLAPDVVIEDNMGVYLGKAFSTPPTPEWDVAVYSHSGEVLFYLASAATTLATVAIQHGGGVAYAAL